ncbi:MAG: hypothetical protein PUC50_08855 [Bacteroidales bacterium]|nr:hypothetical protein [Bacteroidales bacterium]
MNRVIIVMLIALIIGTSAKADCQNVRTNGLGYESIDLGLPSGTLWATCNIGANNPWDYGNYYAWGETSTKTVYNWDTYKYGTNYNKVTKYCTNEDYGNNGLVDNRTILSPSDDAATINMGSGWCIPTKEQWAELIDNTECYQTSKGYRLIGKNGNSIILPFAGYREDTKLYSIGQTIDYWSSTLDDEFPCNGFSITSGGGFGHRIFIDHRNCGLPIRAVRKR